MYRTRSVLDITALKNLFFLRTYSYMNYRNIAFTSTNTAKLKKLAGNQKQALRVVTNEFNDKRKIMVRMKVSNLYKLNTIKF